MEKTNIVRVEGKVPMDCLSGVEFTDVFDGLDTLMRTAGALHIVAKYNADGTMSLEVTDKDGNVATAFMEEAL